VSSEHTKQRPGRGKKGPPEEPTDHALGRSRGGFGTKLHVVCDSEGWLLAARLSVLKYIETFYSTERLHQTLGYKSPNQFETDHAPVIAA